MFSFAKKKKKKFKLRYSFYVWKRVHLWITQMHPGSYGQNQD